MKCWICEAEYEGECPVCGPPQPWGPTPQELLEVLKSYATENDEEAEHDNK
jgi:hypothetical protein